MNVFVTVGTTAFDALIESVDSGPFAENALLQIAEGEYTPKRATWIRFDAAIQDRIDEAEVVICHCGAGSVFGLLQAGIVPVVVPNLSRRDKHQAQLARWLAANRFCVVAMTPEGVNEAIDSYAEQKKNCVPFDVKRFFWTDEFNQLIRTSLN